MSVTWNWRPDPSKTVMMDTETQSVANLSKIGSKAYVRHRTTRLLSMVAKLGRLVVVWAPEGRWPGRVLPLKPGDCWPDKMPRDGTSIMLCTGPTLPEQIQEWVAAGYTFAAHNAAFDSLVWTHLIGGAAPASWYDTLPVCRASGLPGGLDALGRIFSGTGKEEAGKKILKLFYTARLKKDVPVYTIGTVPAWKTLLQYNVKDVLLLQRIFDVTFGRGEPDVMDVDSDINGRGIHFDLDFLSQLLNLWEELQNDAYAQIAELTGGALDKDNLRSVPKMQAWLQKQGIHIINDAGKYTLNKQMLERFYEEPDAFLGGADDGDAGTRTGEGAALACEVLRLRQTVTGISKAKLERILGSADPDNRVRDVLVYCGAHTGRWSGRAFQPHNLARGVADLDVLHLLQLSKAGKLDLPAVREAAAACKATPGKGKPRVEEVMSTLLRVVFCGQDGRVLPIADYAAIEARCVAWLAGEERLLQMFHDGADIYCEMASRIYGRTITKDDKVERQVGKITVLGCGYSMSAPKFTAFCKASRIDLATANTTAEACVEAYRDAWPAIAGTWQGKFRRGGIWHKYQEAARYAVEKKKPRQAGKCLFYMNGEDLTIRLPSGRELIYRQAALEMVVPGYAALLGLKMEPRLTIQYAHHHGFRAGLYGGLLTENISQAVCRDLLANALKGCRAESLPVVMHVHDEIVGEVAEEYAELATRRLAEIMSEPPEWAAGFPIAVEGFCCPRYTKSPFEGNWTVEARNGKVLKMKRKVTA